MSYANTDKFYINGAWVAPHAQNALEVINPATEAPIASIALGSAADVDRAVAAAKAAQADWGQTSKAERLALLGRVLEIYERRQGEFAQAISAEMGAPISMARAQQAAVGQRHLKTTMAALEGFDFEQTLPNGDTLLREPIGVCGLITPWNWPINQIALKVAPALAAGCTMVLKPSEITPLNAILYAEVLDEAGVPPGVFNMVHGMGPEAGAALSRHLDVAMMSFTGSYRGGVAVSADSAPHIKRVTLELGGKSPNLIFADADLEAAVQRGVASITNNTGQSCNAPSRMLVEASVYERAIELAGTAMAQISIGDPAHEGKHIGPLASEAQWNRVQSMIQTGLDEGARLVAGGLGRPDGFSTGYFARPTLFADVRNDMLIAREEIFGPVLVMIPFANEEEAIALANDTDYGLAAYISSGDAARVRRVVRRLEAGMININGNYMAPGSPFGGYKQSGLGREGGVLGLEEFLEMKVLSAF